MDSLSQIDTVGLTALETGTLPATGAAYDMVCLNARHSRAIQALHDTVIDELPPEQKSFILPRSLAYFETHFSRGGGNIILGIVSQGVLAAKAVIVHPDGPLTPSDRAGSVAPQDVPPEQTSILQAVTVHPAYRGNRLLQIMIRHWLAHAQMHDRTHVLAEIEIGNKVSWQIFLKAGLHIVSLGASPVDGAQVYSAHEWLPQERIKYALRKGFDPLLADGEGDSRTCASDDLTAQKQALDDGFVICGRENDGSLVLRRA